MASPTAPLLKILRILVMYLYSLDISIHCLKQISSNQVWRDFHGSSWLERLSRLAPGHAMVSGLLWQAPCLVRGASWGSWPGTPNQDIVSKKCCGQGRGSEDHEAGGRCSSECQVVLCGSTCWTRTLPNIPGWQGQHRGCFTAWWRGGLAIVIVIMSSVRGVVVVNYGILNNWLRLEDGWGSGTEWAQCSVA